MKITDEKLYQLCKQYGSQARLWRQRFIGLLPEVNQRRLFARHGYQSIFEFAAKLAGLSHDQVRLALNLEKRFEDKPALKSLLVEGAVSLSKLTRVVSIATVDNESELAEKVKLLSQPALETLVRDERNLGKSLRPQTLSLELSQEVITELNELHAQGKNVNELLVGLLKARKEKIIEEKETLSQEAATTNSHYISVKTRDILKEEYGDKCSIKTCFRPAVETHHTQRFSLASTHDPKYLAPLCKDHHKIAHTIDQKVQAHRSVSTSYFPSSPKIKEILPSKSVRHTSISKSDAFSRVSSWGCP